jgi:hypothetical protein
MATVQKPRQTNQSTDVGSGLLAIGSSGAWQIDIDEAHSSDRWWMQIAGPTLSLYLEIPSLDIVTKMTRLLALRSTKSKRPANGSAKQGGTLVLSTSAPARVSLVKDDEFDDRYFIVIGPTEGLTMHFTIAGQDLSDITEALRQVKEDLEDV